MKNIHFLIVSSMLFFTACNDRADYFSITDLKIDISVETPLTACTSGYPGFINLDYALNINILPRYTTANPLPVVAQYSCENSSSFELFSGNKKYAPADTILFQSLSKEMKMRVSKPGTYRFSIHFFKENKKDEILGYYEFTFFIGAPDLNMYIVRNGKRVVNLEETENFLESEGSFIVRVNSEKEDLNKENLTLTAKITGSSVQIKNWEDGESKLSRMDDAPQTVDFLVEYKNIQVGKTRFVFTAQTQNSSVVLRDSMNIQESRQGTFTLNTAFHQNGNYYSRNPLWVGQTDTVEYSITPDPKTISPVFKLRFEISEPTKLRLFNTGNPTKQDSNTEYEPNKWYDFSEKKNGKLYYVFPSPVNFSDTIFISMQNGELGAIVKYRLFVSCKQSADFNINATFKPTLADGFDEIKYSELKDGINNLVSLVVSDENPYSKFDYEIETQNANEIQKLIVHKDRKQGQESLSDVAYNTWLANDYGYLAKTKSFKIACTDPNDQNATAFLANTFNWIYTVKRISDGKTKTVTRKIKIVDDRLEFGFELSPLNTEKREYGYINEPHTMYRIIYLLPSLKSSDYSIKFTSTDESIADIYLVNSDLLFRKAQFNLYHSAPASHNQQETSLGNLSGSIQIKGKKVGKTNISFIIRHIKTNTEKTFTKTIEVKNDPVTYSISPVMPSDLQNKIYPTTFGSDLHIYKQAGFKLKIHGSSKFSGNHSGKVKVKFNLSTTNSHTLYLNKTYTNGSIIELEYDTEYSFTFSDNKNTGGWSSSAINAFIKCDIDIVSGTAQETQITTKTNDIIKYRIVQYYCPITLDDWDYRISGYSYGYYNGEDQYYPATANFCKGYGDVGTWSFIVCYSGWEPRYPYTSATVSFTFKGENENSYIPVKNLSLIPAKPPQANQHKGHIVEIKDNWGHLVKVWQVDLWSRQGVLL